MYTVQYIPTNCYLNFDVIVLWLLLLFVSFSAFFLLLFLFFFCYFDVCINVQFYIIILKSTVNRVTQHCNYCILWLCSIFYTIIIRPLIYNNMKGLILLVYLYNKLLKYLICFLINTFYFLRCIKNDKIQNKCV